MTLFKHFPGREEGTLGQKLAGKRFLGNLQGLLQKLILDHVKTPGRGGHGRIKTIHLRLYRLTRTRRYQERMRVSICIAPPAVDNTICRRSAAQLRICFNSISWIFWLFCILPFTCLKHIKLSISLAPRPCAHLMTQFVWQHWYLDNAFARNGDNDDDERSDVSLVDKSILQALAQDKEGLMKLKKSVKDIQQSGTSKSSLISRHRHRRAKYLSYC